MVKVVVEVVVKVVVMWTNLEELTALRERKLAAGSM